jgi:hypothetical protein
VLLARSIRADRQKAASKPTNYEILENASNELRTEPPN